MSDDRRMMAADRVVSQTDWVELIPGDQRYPAQLAAVPRCPSPLYVMGKPEALALPQLAIVGSRAATAAGRETAFEFASALAAAGLAITSGLAIGIDAAAHRGALAAGGSTIAVCGTGLDRIYPAEHSKLAAEIAANGALVAFLRLGAGEVDLVEDYLLAKGRRLRNSRTSPLLVCVIYAYRPCH